MNDPHRVRGRQRPRRLFAEVDHAVGGDGCAAQMADLEAVHQFDDVTRSGR